MLEPQGSRFFPVRLIYGTAYRTDAACRTLLAEGHTLIAVTPRAVVRFGACDCAACAQQADDFQDLSPAAFIAWILEDIRPPAVRLVVHPDMALPLPDGSPSGALRLANEMATAINDHGTPVLLADSLVDGPLEVGTWVRFVRDYLPNERDAVVAGMFGRVVPDPYNICTPGLSVMVEPIGLTDRYGYPCHIVEPIDPPDETQVEAARRFAPNAAALFRQIQGANGGDGEVARAVSELSSLPRVIARLTDPKAIRGHLKRMARLLDGFADSPWAEETVALAARCRAEAARMEASPDLLAAVARWCEKRAASKNR